MADKWCYKYPNGTWQKNGFPLLSDFVESCPAIKRQSWAFLPRSVLCLQHHGALIKWLIQIPTGPVSLTQLPKTSQGNTNALTVRAISLCWPRAHAASATRPTQAGISRANKLISPRTKFTAYTHPLETKEITHLVLTGAVFFFRILAMWHSM